MHDCSLFIWCEVVLLSDTFYKKIPYLPRALELLGGMFSSLRSSANCLLVTGVLRSMLAAKVLKLGNIVVVGVEFPWVFVTACYLLL